MRKRETAMTCPPVDDLSAYLDQELAPCECEQIAAHLQQCPLCQRQLQVFSNLQLAARALPEPALGFDLAANLHDRLQAHPQTRPPASSQPGRSRDGRFSSWLGWIGGVPGGVAASVALAAGLWLGGGLLPGHGHDLPAAHRRPLVLQPPGAALVRHVRPLVRRAARPDRGRLQAGVQRPPPVATGIGAQRVSRVRTAAMSASAATLKP